MSLQTFEEQFGAPAGKALSRLIRPTISAPPGKRLVWGDWSSIEARGLPWLAKAEHRLDVFREIDADPEGTPDVYIQSAAGMYGLDPVEIMRARAEGDKPAGMLRQKGKISELALNFSGASGALQTMAAQYGMSFTAEEAYDIVSRWRAANAWAEEFWNAIWDAFLSAVKRPDGTMYMAGRVGYQGMMVGDQVWVTANLPDGRPLFYRHVRERKHVTYDDFEPDKIVSTEYKMSFESEIGIKWAWRGLLAENATQAICASVLRDALRRLDAPGYDYMPVVGHTHDEIITLTDERHTAPARATLREVMRDPADWHDGLPLEVDVTDHLWYTKALDA